MNYIVAVNGRPGCTVSPLELFSRLSPRWMWVRDQGQHDSGGAVRYAEDDATGAAVGICIAGDGALTRLTEELARMPGAGVFSVQVYPLPAF